MKLILLVDILVWRGVFVGELVSEADSPGEGQVASMTFASPCVPYVGYLAHDRVHVAVHGPSEPGYLVFAHRYDLHCERMCIAGGQGIGCTHARNTLCRIGGLYIL